jgi:Family of unknown function (DUF6338)
MVGAVLTDRRVVGGYYGSKSFPGYGEQSQDLLLEQRWTLDEDNWFVAPAPGSHGLWLSAGSIVSLELYDPVYEQPPENPTADAAEEEAGRAPAAQAGDAARESSPEAGGR